MRRFLIAWLAVLGLVVQLSAAAACAPAPAGAFPICHADGADQAGGDHGPLHHHDECPLCAAHCHAAAVLPPAVGTVAPVVVAGVDPRPAPPPTRSVARVCAGASPRGPPRT